MNRLIKHHVGLQACWRCRKPRHLSWASHSGLPVTAPLCTRCYNAAARKLALGVVAGLILACCLAGWCAGEVPRDTVCRDRCEAVETNWVYSDEGDPQFVQLIFREEDRIIAWRMCRPTVPIATRIPGGWRYLWLDGDITREVECRTIYETHSQYDRETIERPYWPPEIRRQLSVPCVKRRQP